VSEEPGDHPGPRPLASRLEVARYLGLPLSTLERWARLRTGPPYLRIGRHARYRWADVDIWVDAQSRQRSHRHGGAA